MKYTYNEHDLSDLHKDAIGFRPTQYFWDCWMKLDDDAKQREWDLLISMLEDDNGQGD